MQTTDTKVARNDEERGYTAPLNGQSHPPDNGKRLNRILVVEDSLTQAQQLRLILEGEGYEVEVARDGEKGYDLFNASAYDLVISDIQMPGISGFELCRKIKNDPAGRNVPVILLTSLTDSMDIIEGLESGADNFITKAHPTDYLLGRVKAILDNKTLRPEGKLKVGAEVVLLGKKLTINSDKEQIIDLLISTFEDVVRTNRELKAREKELAEAKAQIDRYARQLEGQVRSSEDRYKQANEALNASEEQFHLLVDGVKDYALLMLDSEGNIATWNIGAERIKGYRAEEIIGKHFSTFYPAEEVARGKPEQELRQALAQGRYEEEGWRVRKDGSWFFAHVIITPLHSKAGQHVGFAKVTRDVTERKQAERRLVVRHATRKILAESPTLEDAAPKILKAVCESLGWDVGEVWKIDGQAQVLRCLDFWHTPSATVKEFEAVSRTMTFAKGVGIPGRIWDSGEPAWVPDIAADGNVPRAPIITREGLHGAFGFPIRIGKDILGVMEFFSHAMKQPDEDLLAMMDSIGGQIGQFIERKQAADALQKEQEFLRAVLDNAQDGIVACDSEGTLTLFNRATREFHGIPEEPLPPDQWAAHYDLYLPDGKTRMTKEENPLFRALQGEVVRNVEIVIAPKRAPARTLQASGQAMLDAKGNKLGAVVVLHDLTEQKRLEEQFRQAQKMEAVGQLAGGVAHDFNNLLTVISGYSEVLLSRLPATDPASGLLREINKAGERAAGLTRQLLAFSRKQIIQPKVLDLNALAGDVGKMLRHMIGEDISLVTVLAPRLGRVKADPGQVEQVLMNLAVNARDAMPQGGKLTIETANVELVQSYSQKRPEVQPGRYVLLAISDTGCGMTEEVKRHIFEPFFTTKEPGKGTGLGLATCYGIIKQSGGYLYVYSEPGHGTTFKIYLPLVEDSVPSGKSAQDPKPMPQGSEIILLVEDEDAVRSLSRHVLQMQGYAVLEARDGEEALRVAEQHRGRINLLMTDVVMPRMGGRRLAERLTQAQPGVKVLFLSGYTDDAVVRHGVLEAEVAFLQKPFTPSVLANKVRQVLDQAD